jgi:pyruvate dehydrogenase E1 component
VAVLMAHAFGRIQAEGGAGGSTYLRLSTRGLPQPERTGHAWRAGVVEGAYWVVEPGAGARLAIAYCGALAPEALAAHAALLEDDPDAGLLAVTSPDALHAGWTAAGRSRWTGESTGPSWIDTLLAALPQGAALVTILDGAPSTLSWLGSVRGHRLRALGLETFGQSGDVADLYRQYRSTPTPSSTPAPTCWFKATAGSVTQSGAQPTHRLRDQVVGHSSQHFEHEAGVQGDWPIRPYPTLAHKRSCR